MDSATTGTEQIDRVVRRNTVVLAGCLALSWMLVQLWATVAAPMLSALIGRPALAGLAPAVYVAWWAAATLVAGRFMDKHGRMMGIRLGFIIGAAGCMLVFVGGQERSLASFLLGISMTGAGAGTVNLARGAAADMYPPERRARGISYVLVGAGAGAILGPVVFIPLFARVDSDLDVLAFPWVVGAFIMLGGAALTLAVRVDPLSIARSRGRAAVGHESPARPLRALLGKPKVHVAMITAVVSQGVMTTMMGIVGLVLHQHGHDWPAVSVTLSAHFLGMFGLVLVVGRVVDRIGRSFAALVGLVVVASGILALLAEVRLVWFAPGMFAIGVGWNVAFVAATAMLADATEPLERGKLLGLTDFVAYGTGAVGTLLAGVIVDRWGLGSLAALGTGLALLPVLLLGGRYGHRETRSSALRG